jgi:signal transduction histidine kinase
MVQLTAQDALSPSVVMVAADMRQRDLRSPSSVRYDAYAVFSELIGTTPPTHFLGLVSEQMVDRYPYRIFADLLPFSKSSVVEPNTPLDTLYSDFHRERIEAFSVMGNDHRFLGAVTPTSLLETLLHREREFTTKLQQKLRQKFLMEGHAQIASQELETSLENRTDKLNTEKKPLVDNLLKSFSSEKRERTLLADELHDHLAQILSVGQMKIAQASNLAKDPELLTCLHTIQQLLDESLAYTRTLMTELNATHFHQAGLLSMFEVLTDKLKRYGLHVIMDIKDSIPRLSEDSEFVLYWSIHELLFNVVKHAHVEQANVTIQKIGSMNLQAIVSDTGKGFAPEKPVSEHSLQSHFGLSRIRARLAAVQGTLAIDSTPGKGTRVILTIPFSADSALP